MKVGHYHNISNKFDKLQEISARVIDRFIKKASANKLVVYQKSVWIHLIIISKMQARILDELENSCRKHMKYIERCRRILADPYYQQDDYIALSSDLLLFEGLIKNNSKGVMDIACWIDNIAMEIDEGIIRSALSISYVDWKQFAKRGKHLMTMLISKVGNEPLSWHMTDYILDEIMSNPEGRKMMRKKTSELFPGLFYLDGGPTQ